MFAGLGLAIAPYDGAAEFEVEKVEDLLAFFGDGDYQKVRLRLPQISCCVFPLILFLDHFFVYEDSNPGRSEFLG